MENQKVFQMSFGKIYPLLVNKATRKGRTPEEVDQVITWLTGYSPEAIQEAVAREITYWDFFQNAPRLNPERVKIQGTICGVKIQEIQDPKMKEIRYLDKLIDQLAKGKPLEKILHP